MQTSNTLSIVTFNTNGVHLLSSKVYQRYVLLTKQIEGLQPDIINLQEVLTYDLLYILIKNLPSYAHVIFKKSLLGPKAGLVTFSKLPTKDCKFYKLSTKFSFRSKGVIAVDICNKELTVCNTHLSPNRIGDWSIENKYISLQKLELYRLERLINKLKRKETLILTGDFNVPKDSGLFTDFITKTNLLDAFKNNYTPTFHQEYLPQGRSNHCIDHILYLNSKNEGHLEIKAKRFLFKQKFKTQRESIFISDHLGLFATFSRI